MTEVWVVQLHYGEAPGPVVAVCATRELALSVRSEIREGGFEGGRLAISPFQMAETHFHALSAAFRWLEVLRAEARP